MYFSFQFSVVRRTSTECGRQDELIMEEDDRRGRRRRAIREIMVSVANSVTEEASICAMVSANELTEDPGKG